MTKYLNEKENGRILHGTTGPVGPGETGEFDETQVKVFTGAGYKLTPVGPPKKPAPPT